MYTQAVAKEMWWALVLRGIATLLFGVAAVFWPGTTLVVLVYLFSTYVLISGIVTIIGSVAASKQVNLWFLGILLGLFEVGVGVYLLRHPLVSFATLVILIGFTLIARGIIEVVGTLMSNEDSSTNKMLSIIVGLAAFVVGIVILFQPASAGVAFVWILGLYAIVAGSLEIALAHDVHKDLND